MPVSAVIMATIFLGEALTIETMIGAVLVISGVYVGTSVKRQKALRTPPCKDGISMIK